MKRSSITPFPTGLTSPKFPTSMRVILALILATIALIFKTAIKLLNKIYPNEIL
jgi:hypothetical protein